MCAPEYNDDQEERPMTAYCQGVNYVLKTNAVDDVISEPEADLMTYNQPGNLFAAC